MSDKKQCTLRGSVIRSDKFTDILYFRVNTYKHSFCCKASPNKFLQVGDEIEFTIFYKIVSGSRVEFYDSCGSNVVDFDSIDTMDLFVYNLSNLTLSKEKAKSESIKVFFKEEL
jgi:hypothetical protein